MAINDYVDKLIDRAVILSFSETEIKGFIAFYANNKKDKKAFLSLVLVDESLREQGIASVLLESSIKLLKKRGFVTYNLEVLKNNKQAIRFYKKYGFNIVSSTDTDKFLKMSLDL
jgi:ribosomal protein S18 acetylase RimI-like enzyme